MSLMKKTFLLRKEARKKGIKEFMMKLIDFTLILVINIYILQFLIIKLNMLKKILISLDILGPKPQLKIYSQPHYKTALGGFISVICFIIILSLIISFTFEFFTKSKPFIVQNFEKVENPKLNLSDSPISFYLLDERGNAFSEPNRLYDVSANLFYFDIESKKFKNFSLAVDFDCMKNANKYWPKFEKPPLKDVKLECVVPKYKSGDDIIIYGNFGDIKNGYSFINVNIYKCSNDTKLNKNDCFPSDYIDESLKTPSLFSLAVDYRIDNYDV
jgi:hypothetical protein